MIVNATENAGKFEKIINESGFLGQKIYADYISGQIRDTNSFYVSENCAFMLSGVNLTLCGKPTADELEEILTFCNFCGVSSIESQIKNLPMAVERNLHIMEYAGGETQADDDIISNEGTYSFIKFCCANFHNLNFDIVYSNFARKINKGIANVYYLMQDDKIVSGAISTVYSEDTVYITFVSTLPQYRKRGLAEKVLGHIISRNKDKKVILKCEDVLKPYYEKLGFKAVGAITVYKE
ncbi:MAG: GNAT family N-acetyltransferase [Oscillospiraceae bacterium]|nr:GNAT family N-acetyltransferase [Oscillospiraceae bacterium]